jgi:glycine C-acetyltransferase
MRPSLQARLQAELAQFRQDGVYKRLNYLDSPQGPRVKMEGRGEIIILSSNNYLGLSNVPEVVAAGKTGLERFGAGTASVRFICGTFTVHRELERTLADLVGTESSLTYVSCWNANEGLSATLLGPDDIVISDELNHASIIDSIRLAKTISKCQSAVYRHSDMKDLEDKLQASRAARTRLVFTDGIFSMEGDIARLPDILELAERHDAVVAMDDSHASGVLGKTGRAQPSTTAWWGRWTSSPRPWARRWAGRPGGSRPLRRP